MKQRIDFFARFEEKRNNPPIESLLVIVRQDITNNEFDLAGPLETWIADASFPVLLHRCLVPEKYELFALNAIALEKIGDNLENSELLRTILKYSDRFSFILILEPSTYLNIKQIMLQIKTLESYNHLLFYAGASDNQVRNSKLKFKPCSSESGGVLLGSDFIRRISLHIRGENNISNDHDFYNKVSLLAQKNAFLSCYNIFPKLMDYPSNVIKSILAQREDSYAISSEILDFHWIGPLKSYIRFRKLHAQIQYFLRPIVGYQYTEEDLKSIPYGTCVHNPSMQLHYVPGLYLPECPSLGNPEYPKVKNIPAFMLNLPEEDKQFELTASGLRKFGISSKKFSAVRGSLLSDMQIKELQFGIKEMLYENNKKISVDFPLKQFPKPFVMSYKDVAFDQMDISPLKRTLKAGEVGYRLSMQQLFAKALVERYPYILIFDDDAVPYCDFQFMWKKLTESSRCTSVFSDFREQRGKASGIPSGHAVLMLGAAVWNEGTYPNVNSKDSYGGWKMAFHDITNHSMSSSCFNLNNRTFGSFGVIYPYSSYEIILDWMIKEEKPFDWVFEYLSIVGFPVRIAYPNLIIQNVAHESRVDPGRKNTENVDHRAKLHRWDLRKYCLASGPLIST